MISLLRAARFAALVSLSAGCSNGQLSSIAGAQDSAHPHKRKSETASAAPNDAGVAPAPATATTAIDTRTQLVSLVLDPSIRNATPEQTESRLAPLGEFTRSSMFPDQLDLRADNTLQRVLVEYVQGKSGFQFAHLRVALWSAPGAELKAAYDAIDAQLNKALGKPQWTKKVPQSQPNRAYRVGKKLSIVLGEGLEKGKSFVRLELSEEQGERD